MAKTQILVIDDDRTILEMLKITLVNAGFEPLTALDGDVGLSVFREKKPSLVIVDIAMPGIDGYQVIEGIREADSKGEHVPIVILTAHEQNVMRDYAKELGTDLYLTKPILPQQLVEHIKRLLTEKT